MSKTTEWLPSHIKPVQIGVYQTPIFSHHETTEGYAFWNGQNWCPICCSVESADQYKNYQSIVQKLAWRGLKVDEL